MLGEEYLETRKSLGAISKKIHRLAVSVGCDSSELEDELLEEFLESPFRVMVCGDKESGKTSCLSALVGEDLDMSDGKAIQLYGSRILSSEKKSSFLGYSRVVGLGELELIDTRGIGELSGEERAKVMELMVTCDYVLWVVSSVNPWASKTWDFVTETRGVVGSRSGVVLQKVDLRPVEDVAILLDHLSSLCIQRVGHALPMHCVSASLAADARVGGGVDGKLWAASGYEKLELALDRLLSTSQRREGAMREVYDRSKLVIDRLEETILTRARALQGDKRVLQAVEAEVDRARDVEVKSSRENLNKIGGAVADQVDDTVNYARQKNGVIGTLISLFTRGDGAVEVEKCLQESVCESAGLRASEIGFKMLRRCEENWNIMRPELQRKMEVDVVDFDAAGFSEKVGEFSAQVVDSTRHAMDLLKLRRLLDRMMIARQRVLKRALMIVLGLVGLAGFIGYFDDDLKSRLPFVMLGLAGVLVLWMLWYGKKTKDGLIEDYKDTVLDARLHLSEMISRDYCNSVRVFYTGYFPMFENIRRYIVEAESDLEPKQKEWHELFLMLRAIEQDL